MAQIHNIVSGLLAIVLTRCPRHYEVNSYGDKNRVTVDYPVNVHGVQQYRMDGGHYQYRITMKGNCEITDFENDGNIDHVWCEFRMDASFKEKPLAVIDSRQLYNNLIAQEVALTQICDERTCQTLPPMQADAVIAVLPDLMQNGEVNIDTWMSSMQRTPTGNYIGSIRSTEPVYSRRVTDDGNFFQYQFDETVPRRIGGDR